MIRVFVATMPEGAEVELAAEEAHYLTRVRRVSLGERVEIRDREGRRAEAVVERVGRDGVAVRVVRRLPDASTPVPIHLLVAAPKRDLLDDVVRASSELGAARLTPLVTGRSVMRPGDGRLERWRRIAVEAVRQCGRGAPLLVDPPVPFAAALDSVDPRSTKVLLHPHLEAMPLALAFLRADGSPRAAEPITLAVGPEGGFEEPEVEMALCRGFLGASLGDNILRVETAAIAAVAIAAALAGGARPPRTGGPSGSA